MVWCVVFGVVLRPPSSTIMNPILELRMLQHVAICKLLTETKRGMDYTDPVMPIGKLHAVKTLFSCGQALSRLSPAQTVTRPRAQTRGARFGIARFPNFRGVFTSANLLRQKCCRHHCREYSRKHMDDAGCPYRQSDTHLSIPSRQPRKLDMPPVCLLS